MRGKESLRITVSVPLVDKAKITPPPAAARLEPILHFEQRSTPLNSFYLITISITALSTPTADRDKFSQECDSSRGESCNRATWIEIHETTLP